MDPYKFMFDNRDKASRSDENALTEQHGNVFTYTLLGRKMTVALGPSGTNFILNGRISHVSAEEAYTHLTTPVFGTDVVYDVPNPILMEQKKFVKVGLSTDHFKRYVGLIRDEVIGVLRDEVLKGKDGPVSVDAFKVSSETTILTASATLQGAEVRAGMDKSFAQLYHDRTLRSGSSDVAVDGGFTPLNFAFPNLPLPSYRRRDRAQLAMRNFYLDILKRRRDSKADPPNDMLTALQGNNYKDGRALSDKEIAHIMIALLMAGQHTSAATGAWLMLHLGHMPELRRELYEEQVKYHGNEDGSLRPLTYDTLQTPLLMACIREVLRLHPPLHSLMRKVIRDMPVPLELSPGIEAAKKGDSRQFIVPKGHFILAAPGVSHIDPTFWQDPMEFDPKRWLTGGQGADITANTDEEEKVDFGFGAVSTGAGSHYLPFGAGRHRCIGEQFANVQLSTIVATLIREADWSLDTKTVPAQDYTVRRVIDQRLDAHRR